MNKKALILVLFSFFVLPVIVYADVTVQSMVVSAAKTAWVIATGVVVILWLVTGILFLTAQGDPGKLGSAKKALLTSVAGTVIVVLAYSALNLIKNIID